ncbi:MAG: PfkB family carbohydrate kinase [Candidatus Zixiibacteriota bacterium]
MSRRKDCKIAVIGTINRDTVIRADKSRVEGFGGILYNLTALSRLLGNSAEIYPVANLGADHEREIRKRLGAFPNVLLPALETVAAANNHCQLTYTSVSEKAEVLRGWVGGVRRAKLRSVFDADYILVNFISGSDISTSNLKWLREKSSAIIYIDFHSRTLGRRANGQRFLRRPKDWREAVRCADILQMNDVEFELLAGEAPSQDSCGQFVKTLLAKTAQGLVVTLGSKGCFVTRRGKAGIESKFIPAPRVNEVVDTTGCGDVFSGAFLAAFSQGLAFEDAAVLAVRAASARAGVNEIEQVDYRRLARLLGSKSVAK